MGIWAPNVPEWTQVQYATAMNGAILVNINPAYRVHELEYVLTQSGVRALVAVPQFKASDDAAMIVEVRPRCLNDPDFASFDLSSLRTGIMADSPCPVEVMKQVIDRMGMPDVTICYGMTETSPASWQTRVDDTLDQRTATVGRVHPHLEMGERSVELLGLR